MTVWLLNAPLWKRALVYGVPFGVLMAGFSVVQGSSWAGSALGGAGGGVVFGLLMGKFLPGLDPEMIELQAVVRAAGRREVGRAVRRGPVPADPEVRVAAAALVAYQLPIMERQRSWAPLFFLVMIVVSGALALTVSPGYWVAVAFFAVLLFWQLVLPGRLRRRAELLGVAGPES